MSSRFWTGKKRIAKKHFKQMFREKGLWQYFEKNGLPKPGDVSHDCSGRNVELSEVFVEMIRTGRHIRVPAIEAIGTKGEIVCECMGMGFQKPLSREYVDAYIRSWASPKGKEVSDKWNMKIYEQATALIEGKAFVDERGIFNVD